MFKLNDINFLKFCVDMSDQEQGQLIDPSQLICGRRPMTQSARRARKNAHIQKRGRGKGRRRDGSRTSQATQPEQSHVVDPTQVEYRNYQDQIHHEATNGGYDQQHIPEDVVSVLDQDDIAAATAQETLPDQAPFLGGPEDTSLLASYVNHAAFPLWYNSNNVSGIFNGLKLSYATYICVF